MIKRYSMLQLADIYYHNYFIALNKSLHRYTEQKNKMLLEESLDFNVNMEPYGVISVPVNDLLQPKSMHAHGFKLMLPCFTIAEINPTSTAYIGFPTSHQRATSDCYLYEIVISIRFNEIKIDVLSRHPESSYESAKIKSDIWISLCQSESKIFERQAKTRAEKPVLKSAPVSFWKPWTWRFGRST